MKRSICLMLWLGCFVFGAKTSYAATPDATLRRIIDWMPQDVETLAVARGSLRLPQQVSQPGKAAPLSTTGTPAPDFWSSAALFSEYVTRCAPGETLNLAMEGRRKFRPPGGLGLMRYEGCAVFQLAPTAATTQSRLAANILKHAKSKIRIATTDVGVYPQKSEQDNWTFYVCSPAPNTVLVATEHSFLQTVLARRVSRIIPEQSALPATWSGWSNVDTAAPFWAVRRWSAGNGPFPVSKPDSGAQSLTVSLTGKQLIWRYRGKSREVVAEMKKVFERETKLPTKTALLATDLQECRVDLRKATDHQIGYLSFFLLGFMGPAIFV